MICPTDLRKQMFRKITKKSQAKVIQENLPLLNLKKHFQITFFFFFLTVCRKTSELLSFDPCARLKTQTRIHSISWGCPKILSHSDPILLLISTFGIHRESGCKSHGRIIHYRTAKNVQKTKLLSIFRRILIA